MQFARGRDRQAAHAAVQRAADGSAEGLGPGAEEQGGGGGGGAPLLARQIHGRVQDHQDQELPGRNAPSLSARH